MLGLGTVKSLTYEQHARACHAHACHANACRAHACWASARSKAHLSACRAWQRSGPCTRLSGTCMHACIPVSFVEHADALRRGDRDGVEAAVRRHAGLHHQIKSSQVKSNYAQPFRANSNQAKPSQAKPCQNSQVEVKSSQGRYLRS